MKGTKSFWKICKPYLPNNHSRKEYLYSSNWRQKNRQTLNNLKDATFINYFSEIILSLNLFKQPEECHKFR